MSCCTDGSTMDPGRGGDQCCTGQIQDSGATCATDADVGCVLPESLPPSPPPPSGSSCESGTCNMCEVDMPSTELTLGAGPHTLKVDVTTWDDKYHYDAYFEISFHVKGKICGY